MTNKKIECGCLTPILPCFYSLNPDDASSREQSNIIDKQLAKEKKGFAKTHRVLLLGAGESGKSTIIKQMQLIHVNKFSEPIRLQRRDDIRDNLLDAIVSILAAMPTMAPPVPLEVPDNEPKSKWILDHATKQDFEFPSKFYDYIEALWRDKGVQLTYERSHEYHLIDSAKYFLDRLHIIRKADYLPTDQDILRCRVLTTEISELTFHVNKVTFRLIDVGGQRDERRKWFLCFNDVTAIIFVTACSSYNLVLREDSSKNRLRESLDLFKVVWNNRWLGHISVILFLNKQDIFREKILSGRSKLEDYFPAYSQFTEDTEKPKKGHATENPNVIRAQNFIKRLFVEISAATSSNPQSNHNLYPHFTCATDTENMKRVFDACRDDIQRKHLVDNNLI